MRGPLIRVFACALVATLLAGGPSWGAGPATGAIDPATLPWAMRSLPNRGTMYLIAHSSIGIVIPDQLQCGEVAGVPALIEQGGGLEYLMSATRLRSTTRPASDALPVPAADLLGTTLKPIQITLTAEPPVVDTSTPTAYAVRYAAANCHAKPVAVLEMGLLVGSTVVDCVVLLPADDPRAVAAAKSNAAMLLQRAKVVQRLAVNGHNEVAPPTAAVAPPAPAPTAQPARAAPARPVYAGPVTPAQARLNTQAATALAAAQKLKADGKDASAYDHFRYVAKQYAKTPAAVEAQSAVDAYEADADFMSAYRSRKTAAPTTHPTASPASAADRAASLLSLADQYVARGRPDLARAKYQAVIDQFPTLAAAAKARDRLAKLSATP